VGSGGYRGWAVWNKAGCREDSFQLVGDGSSAYKGRVEVCKNNKWGTVCDDGFKENEGDLVCRKLGFSGVAKLYGDHGKKSNTPDLQPYGRGRKQPVHVTSLECPSSALKLSDCSYEENPKERSDTRNCQHFEDVGLDCNE